LKFLDFQAEVEEVLADSCRALGFKDLQIEVSLPPNDTYGDLASAIPIRIAKEAGKNPGDVAIEVASKAMELAKKKRYIGAVSPTGEGTSTSKSTTLDS